MSSRCAALSWLDLLLRRTTGWPSTWYESPRRGRTRPWGRHPRRRGGPPGRRRVLPPRPERVGGGAPGTGNPHCSARVVAGRTGPGRISAPDGRGRHHGTRGMPLAPRGRARGGAHPHPRSRPARRSGFRRATPPPCRAGSAPRPPGTYSSRPPRWRPESCSDIAVPLLRVLHTTGPRKRPTGNGCTDTRESSPPCYTGRIRRSTLDVIDRPPRSGPPAWSTVRAFGLSADVRHGPRGDGPATPAGPHSVRTADGRPDARRCGRPRRRILPLDRLPRRRRRTCLDPGGRACVHSSFEREFRSSAPRVTARTPAATMAALRPSTVILIFSSTTQSA
jgi:hypothetical protein